MDYETVLHQVDLILNRTENREQKLQSICELLEESVEPFDWVGFYLASKEEQEMLVLGPYTGEPTDHKKIPFGTGICGQAAATLDTFVVQDVSKADNYLACSIDVKSEIVVPILKNGEFIGELDIDSHTRNAMTPELRELCEEICRKVVSIF
ncbi:MAG: GAF domain-containing protein [Balneolaceae bacterium]